jgi:hypothetical protein
MTKKAPGSSWHRSLVLVAAIALSVAACGGSKHTATVGIGSSFAAKANAICAKAVAKHDAHPFPVPSFNPLHPSARDLPAVGRYFAQYGNAAGTTARLDALAAPPRHHADWEKLRALIDDAAVNAQRQIAVAERSDIAGFEQTVTTARSLAKQINEIGPRLGFTSSSACSKLFG